MGSNADEDLHLLGWVPLGVQTPSNAPVGIRVSLSCRTKAADRADSKASVEVILLAEPTWAKPHQQLTSSLELPPCGPWNGSVLVALTKLVTKEGLRVQVGLVHTSGSIGLVQIGVMVPPSQVERWKASKEAVTVLNSLLPFHILPPLPACGAVGSTSSGPSSNCSQQASDNEKRIRYEWALAFVQRRELLYSPHMKPEFTLDSCFRELPSFGDLQRDRMQMQQIEARTLDDMPEEVMLQVLSFLDPEDQARVQQTCKYLNVLVMDLAPGLKLPLFPHQRAAVRWMVLHERAASRQAAAQPWPAQLGAANRAHTQSAAVDNGHGLQAITGTHCPQGAAQLLSSSPADGSQQVAAVTQERPGDTSTQSAIQAAVTCSAPTLPTPSSKILSSALCPRCEPAKELEAWACGHVQCRTFVTQHGLPVYANLVRAAQFAATKKACIARHLIATQGTLKTAVTGHLSLEEMEHVRPIRGGFFCDEPGLGKTVTAMSLILKTRGKRPAAPAHVKVDEAKVVMKRPGAHGKQYSETKVVALYLDIAQKQSAQLESDPSVPTATASLSPSGRATRSTRSRNAPLLALPTPLPFSDAAKARKRAKGTDNKAAAGPPHKHEHNQAAGLPAAMPTVSGLGAKHHHTLPSAPPFSLPPTPARPSGWPSEPGAGQATPRLPSPTQTCVVSPMSHPAIAAMLAQPAAKYNVPSQHMTPSLAQGLPRQLQSPASAALAAGHKDSTETSGAGMASVGPAVQTAQCAGAQQQQQQQALQLPPALPVRQPQQQQQVAAASAPAATAMQQNQHGNCNPQPQAMPAPAVIVAAAQQDERSEGIQQNVTKKAKKQPRDVLLRELVRLQSPWEAHDFFELLPRRGSTKESFAAEPKARQMRSRTVSYGRAQGAQTSEPAQPEQGMHEQPVKTTISKHNASYTSYTMNCTHEGTPHEAVQHNSTAAPCTPAMCAEVVFAGDADSHGPTWVWSFVDYGDLQYDGLDNGTSSDAFDAPVPDSEQHARPAARRCSNQRQPKPQNKLGREGHGRPAKKQRISAGVTTEHAGVSEPTHGIDGLATPSTVADMVSHGMPAMDHDGQQLAMSSLLSSAQGRSNLASAGLVAPASLGQLQQGHVPMQPAQQHFQPAAAVGTGAAAADGDTTHAPADGAEAVVLSDAETWVLCDACHKWRRIPEDLLEDPEAQWFCNMNPDAEKAVAGCDAPEEAQEWQNAGHTIVVSQAAGFVRRVDESGQAANIAHFFKKLTSLPKAILGAASHALNHLACDEKAADKLRSTGLSVPANCRHNLVEFRVAQQHIYQDIFRLLDLKSLHDLQPPQTDGKAAHKHVARQQAHTWIQPDTYELLYFDQAAFQLALAKLVHARHMDRQLLRPVLWPLVKEVAAMAEQINAASADRIFLSRATLVVVPPTLVQHWQQQIQRHVKSGYLKVYVLTKNDADISIKDLAWGYDVVLTTFSRLSAEWAPSSAAGALASADRIAPSPSMLKVHWLRVILDEGHVLGNSLADSNVKQVLCQLKAERRWIMTGTPTPSMGDSGVAHLQPLLAFLHHDPFGNSKRTWEQAVLAPLKDQKPYGRDILLHLLKANMIRATKSALIQLPALKKVVVPLDFARAHAASYNALVEVVQRNLLLADWGDGNHIESLMNKRQSKWAQEMMRNVRQSCCVAGSMNLQVTEQDLWETLELLSDKLGHPLPARAWFLYENPQYLERTQDPTTLSSSVPAGPGGISSPAAAAAVPSRTTVQAALTSSAGAPHSPLAAGPAPRIPDHGPQQVPMPLFRHGNCVPPNHPLKYIENATRNGCACQLCNEFSKLPIVTPCGHLLCLGCAWKSSTACPHCGDPYRMQEVDDPERLKFNPSPKWPVPIDVIEWQPVFVQEGSKGATGGEWSPSWQITQSTRCLYLIKRLMELGVPCMGLWDSYARALETKEVGVFIRHYIQMRILFGHQQQQQEGGARRNKTARFKFDLLPPAEALKEAAPDVASTQDRSTTSQPSNSPHALQQQQVQAASSMDMDKPSVNAAEASGSGAANRTGQAGARAPADTCGSSACDVGASSTPAGSAAHLSAGSACTTAGGEGSTSGGEDVHALIRKRAAAWFAAAGSVGGSEQPPAAKKLRIECADGQTQRWATTSEQGCEQGSAAQKLQLDPACGPTQSAAKTKAHVSTAVRSRRVCFARMMKVRRFCSSASRSSEHLVDQRGSATTATAAVSLLEGEYTEDEQQELPQDEGVAVAGSAAAATASESAAGTAAATGTASAVAACSQQVAAQHAQAGMQGNSSGFAPGIAAPAVKRHKWDASREPKRSAQKKAPPGPKAIVFSQFWTHLQLIEQELKRHKINYLLLTSATKPAERPEVIRSFARNPNVGVLLMDETGSVGLDLSFVTNVFLMEPIADKSLEHQVISRAHRMGTQRPVTVELLYMRNTAEEHMVMMAGDAPQGQDSATAASPSALAQAVSSSPMELADEPAVDKATTAGSANRSPSQGVEATEDAMVQAAAVAGAGARRAAAAAAGTRGDRAAANTRNMFFQRLRKVNIGELKEYEEDEEADKDGPYQMPSSLQ